MQHRMRLAAIRRSLGATILTASLASCRALGAGDCSHTFRDPVVAIRTARDSATAAPISRVALTAFTVGGRPTDSVTLLPNSVNVRLVADTLICTIPCGFSNIEGHYAFLASAPGYGPRTVSVSAQYAHFDGGCPSSSGGSTNASIALSRQD